jgi:hypothetical protein
MIIFNDVKWHYKVQSIVFHKKDARAEQSLVEKPV